MGEKTKDNDKKDILSDFEVDSEEGTSSHGSDHQGIYICISMTCH